MLQQLPQADYVSLITKMQTLPDEQLSFIANQGGTEAPVASWLMKNRMGDTGPMGLGGKMSPAARSIPSSFPDSEILKRVQGDPSLMMMPPADAMPRGIPPIPSDIGLASRPTVVGAAPPPTRGTDPPAPPQPVTPEPITAAAAAEQEDPERRDKGMALMQAGLAILASNNRSGLGAIGEGGLVGLQALQRSRSDRKRDTRDEKLFARQEARDAQQTDMQIQKMELEKQLAEQRMALAREEMDITRSRYDPSNPAVAASIDRDRAAAEASRRAVRSGGSGGGGGGGGGGGVNFGNSAKGLAVARLVNSGQLTPEQGAMYLAESPVTGPNGELGIRRPGSDLEQVRAPVLSGQEKDAIMEADKTVESGTAAAEALKQAMELNPKALSGPTASLRATADRVLPGDYGGAATTEYDNLVRTQALERMKTLFGSNPTEGERAAMMDLQASVDKTTAEREAILKRSLKTTEDRTKREQGRASALREGTYYKEGLSAPPKGNTRLVYDPATGEFKPK